MYLNFCTVSFALRQRMEAGPGRSL